MDKQNEIFEANYNKKAFDRISEKIVTLEEPILTLNHNWTYWIATDENGQYLIINISYLHEIV